MCYYVEQKVTDYGLKDRFKIPIDIEDDVYYGDFINGFAYPNLPVIIDKTSNIISTNYNWGLVPSWAKDLDIRKNTLNARIETIDEKPSFSNITQNRCLIIATAYYEWRWLDEKGKVKEKYKINSQEDEIFTFAGLYNEGKNPGTGQPLNTFTMVTTQANDVMKYVHNHKQRMPIMLQKKDETAWLDHSNKIQDFAFPYDGNLIAFKTT